MFHHRNQPTHAVETYVPDFAISRMGKSRRPVTLRQLASHTSGLPREHPCPGCGEDEILRLLSHQFLVAKPYTTPHYSNVGVSLLGRALAYAAKASSYVFAIWWQPLRLYSSCSEPVCRYEELVTTEVLKPLGFSAAFDYDQQVQRRLAIGSHRGKPAEIEELE